MWKERLKRYVSICNDSTDLCGDPNALYSQLTRVYIYIYPPVAK